MNVKEILFRDKRNVQRTWEKNLREKILSQHTDDKEERFMTQQQTKKQFTLLQPRERSFEAFKEYFCALKKAVTGQSELTISDDELRESWEKFWKDAE